MKTLQRRLAVLLTMMLTCANPLAAQVLPLADGSFEQGGTRWSPTGEFHVGLFGNAYTGRRVAQFGLRRDGRSAANNATGSIEQSVTIPTSPAGLGLIVWIWTTTEETDALVHDTLTIDVLDNAAGTLLERRVVSNLDKGSDYVRHSVPLATYAGKRVRIRFRGASDRAKATVFRVDDVALTPLPNPTASFHGTVRSTADNAPIANVLLEWGAFSAKTNANGAYAFVNVPCQTATLRASVAGYQPFEQLGYAPNCFGGSSVRNVMLTPRDTTASGTVTDKWTGAGIPGVRVQHGTAVAITASDGTYGVKLAACGSPVTITVTAPRFKTATRTYTPACRTDNIQHFQLDPEITSFSVRTTPSAEVTWGGQKPLTAEGGVYTFAGVPCQSALLEVRLAGYEPFRETYTPICNESVWKTITLVPKSTRFGGTVTLLGTPVPVAGATLDYNGIQVKTDVNGAYSFWSVPCSTATLTVTADSYLRWKQTYTPKCEGDNTKNIVLTLAPTSGTFVCGTITDPTTTKGVRGALLTLGKVTATTDADGRYCLSRVACATDTLWIQATGYPTFSQRIAPLCLRVQELDLDMNPFAVSGRVDDVLADEALPGVTVQWGSRTVITGQNGRYDFVGCGDGPVVITKPGYEPQQYNAITCKDGVHTSFRYVHLRPSASTANLFVRAWFGGVVELDGRVATPTTRGYALFGLPCGKTATLSISAPLYQTARLLYMPLCGTSNLKEVTLLQRRTFISGVVLRGPNRVPDARVTWGEFSGTTNAQGMFAFENIVCGRADTLTVTKAGFHTHTETVIAKCPGSGSATVQLIPVVP